MSWTSSRLNVAPEIDAPHFRVRADLGRRSLRDQLALMQHRDFLRDREHDVHVVLGEQERELALRNHAFEEPDRITRLAR